MGPPTGDRYAPFIEEEWDDDSAVLPGGDMVDDVVNGVEARVESNDLDQVSVLLLLFCRCASFLNCKLFAILSLHLFPSLQIFCYFVIALHFLIVNVLLFCRRSPFLNCKPFAILFCSFDSLAFTFLLFC